MSVRKILLLISLLIFPLMFCGCGEKPIAVLEFNNRPDGFSPSDAILWDYIKKDLGFSEKELKSKFNIDKSGTFSLEYDLNDDGVNEIIGFNSASVFLGTLGYNIYVLKKEKDGYENIDIGDNTDPYRPIYILKSKTNGFHDMKASYSIGNNFKSFKSKYNGENYQLSK